MTQPDPPRRPVDRFADLVLRRSALVVVGWIVVGAACAQLLPDLEVDLAPGSLVADTGDDGARRDAGTLLVVIEADDVLGSGVLAWVHGLARELDARPWSGRIDSLTTTPLPHLAPAEVDADVTLDDLERDADLPIEAPEAVRRVVASSPERFPRGVATLSERLEGGRIAVGPLVDGERIDEAERRAVVQVAERSPLVRRRLVDGEGTLTVVAAELEAGIGDRGASDAVTDARELLADHPPPAGVTARLGGLPHVRAELVRTLRADQALLVVLACIGSFAVLILAFRSLGAVVLPLAAVGTTLAVVMGGMSLAGEPVNLLTNVLPPLLVTIGLGDAVHLLSRYREELRSDPDRGASARRTMRAMTTACLLTSLTTAVGFGSLVASGTGVLQRFGLIAATGVLVAYAVTVTLLPAALPRFGGIGPAPDPGRSLATALGRIGRLATARPGWIVAAAAALLIGCGLAARDVPLDSALMDAFDPDSEVARTVGLLEDRLDGVRSMRVRLDTEPGLLLEPETLRALDDAAADLEGSEDVLRVSTHAEPLRAAWMLLAGEDAAGEAFGDPDRVRALGDLVGASGAASLRRVSSDGSRAYVDVRIADTGMRRTASLAESAEGRFQRLEGVRATAGGEAVTAARGLGRVVADLLSSLGLAVLTIFAMLGLLFRSPRLALISVPPNLLPLAVVLAWMTWRTIPLSAATLIVFAISLGLAVDGTIHILARYREELGRGQGRDAAIGRALVGSGRAVVLGSATLLVGFASLGFSGFVPIRRFAELSAVAIGAALLAELLLLPALLSMAGGAHAALRTGASPAPGDDAG